MRWLGHSNLTLCNITCSNFFHSQAAGTQKLLVGVLEPSLTPESPSGISTTYFFAIYFPCDIIKSAFLFAKNMLKCTYFLCGERYAWANFVTFLPRKSTVKATVIYLREWELALPPSISKSPSSSSFNRDLGFGPESCLSPR